MNQKYAVKSLFCDSDLRCLVCTVMDNAPKKQLNFITNVGSEHQRMSTKTTETWKFQITNHLLADGLTH